MERIRMLWVKVTSSTLSAISSTRASVSSEGAKSISSFTALLPTSQALCRMRLAMMTVVTWSTSSREGKKVEIRRLTRTARELIESAR